MSNYALVEDGIIKVQQDSLPTSWKNISGLHHSKEDESLLNSVGWYTIVKESIDLQPDEHIIGYTLRYENNIVIGSPIVKNKLINENFEADKVRFMSKLREARDEYLRKSDWTQLSDVQQLKSQDWINAWKSYRDQLRSLPVAYENNNTISLYDVSWPEPPTT